MFAEQFAARLDALDKPLQGAALAYLFGKAGDDGRAGGGIQMALDTAVDKDLHMPLCLADEDQYTRGTSSALQVLFAKLLAGQARSTPAAQGPGDQAAGQAWAAQQQAQADEQQHIGHQQATHSGPTQLPVQQGRHGQRQHGGPEQRPVGIVVGPAGQHRHQFGIGAPFGTGNGFGDLALMVFIEGGHAVGLLSVLIVVVPAFGASSAGDIFRHNPPLEEMPANRTTIAA